MFGLELAKRAFPTDMEDFPQGYRLHSGRSVAILRKLQPRGIAALMDR